jgi:signal transduction histidine kinase/HPt (histidine-containing phosphotransfer) domain-containing protein
MLPANTNDGLATAVLEGLGLAVFERREDGLFRLWGAVPEWLETLFPEQVDTRALDIADVFPFLELFLTEADGVIGTGGRAQSDIWTQHDRHQRDQHLRALAISVGARLLLVIQPATAEHQERSLALQGSHDAQLQADRIERMRRELADLNEQLKARNEEVERATRAKSEFLAAMSHEIRTPMNAIIGVADLLQQTLLTAEQKKYVTVFQAAGENLLTLINDILDLSKVESGEVKLESVSFDLRDLVSSVVEIAQVRAKAKGLAVTYSIGANVPANLVGDPNRLRQVLLNLVGNSVKFTEKGSVGIGINVNPDAEPGRLHFVVSDTGIGIPADKLGRIFESFAQADSSTTRKYGGTGLGLSISRHLLELMKGHIWVESDVGVGSKFHFTAEFALSADAPPSSPAVVGHDLRREAGRNIPVESITPGLRILLADDSEDNRFLMLSYLKETRSLIDIAENGKLAVEKFATGNYDLVLMDVEMPEMDGYEAVRTIRQMERNRTEPTPVLALTAHAFQEAIAKSLEAGFTDHLTKPIRRSALLEVIGRYSPPTPATSTPSGLVFVDPSLEDMIPRFLEKRRQDVPKMTEAVQVGDYETVRRLGHNLKGTGAGYGFNTLSELGTQIEEAAEAKDAATIRIKVEELTQYLSSVQWIASESSVEA